MYVANSRLNHAIQLPVYTEMQYKYSHNLTFLSLYNYIDKMSWALHTV